MLIYDIETFPNYWCLCAKSTDTGKRYYFEISPRVDHRPQLSEFMTALKQQSVDMLGFFNLTYDYPVLHRVLNGEDPYRAGQAVFNADRFDKKVRNPYVRQIDMAPIMGYDTFKKATSLKKLEFFMRMDKIQDLPYDPHTPLTYAQMDEVYDYCMNSDVEATHNFYNIIKPHIDFRLSLNDPYLLNVNDIKLGESFVINEIGRGNCYFKGKKIQTVRESINLNECIKPLAFKHIELKKVQAYLQSRIVKETKGVFNDLTAVIDNFKLVFGLGGMHGAVSREKFVADKKWKIIDVDVTGYYPSLIVENNFEPAHLQGMFSPVFVKMKADRAQFAKGTVENKRGKLGSNGSFGMTNFKNSVFYDPQCMMKITLNGQLQLCRLFEQLVAINQVEPIQINTDGITCYVRETKIEQFMTICKQWESQTGLNLERADYSRLWIRDVNSYIAEYPGGKLKLKGAYAVDRDPEKSHDSLIVQKAVRDYLVHGKSYQSTVLASRDPFDFCNFVKSNHKLWLGDQEIQRRSRYYVSTAGKEARKELKNGRVMTVLKDRLIKECNRIERFDWSDVDYDYYISECRKLVI